MITLTIPFTIIMDPCELFKEYLIGDMHKDV